MRRGRGDIRQMKNRMMEGNSDTNQKAMENTKQPEMVVETTELSENTSNSVLVPSTKNQKSTKEKPKTRRGRNDTGRVNKSKQEITTEEKKDMDKNTTANKKLPRTTTEIEQEGSTEDMSSRSKSATANKKRVSFGAWSRRMEEGKKDTNVITATTAACSQCKGITLKGRRCKRKAACKKYPDIGGMCIAHAKKKK